MGFWKKYFGPSTLVAAAFIGPGTVTVCTLAGARTGYTLLWALLFSVLATIFLQEMTARLGLITRFGLGEALRQELKNPVAHLFSAILVLSAIVVGNAAYEAGNISGAVLGLEEIFGQSPLSLWPLLIGGGAFLLLLTGSYRLMERLLIALVLLMSFIFLLTALLLRPSLTDILSGLFLPSAGEADWLLVVGLIGTTVVPYNLFLHASSVQEKWKKESELPALRWENAISIGLGGLISMGIVVTSAAALHGRGSGVENAADMALQLEPLLGSWARYVLAAGLFAAGLTSAITAPLAAAYAARGILGWRAGWTDLRFRAVWMFILLVGTLFAALGYRPVVVIQFGQFANGLLLPIVAGFLLYIMNRKALLGKYINRPWQNAIGLAVVALTVLLGAKSLWAIFVF